MRSLLAATLVAATLLLALPAHAQQNGGNVAAARAAFEQGLTLLDQHQFDRASAQFERSLTLRESASARYNLALAYRGGHHLLRAIDSLRRLLASPSESAREMLEDAARVLAELERTVAHVTLRVTGNPAELTVDGTPVAPLGEQTLELDPGRHVFSGRAEGRAPVESTRDFADGATQSVVLDVALGGAAPAHLVVRTSRPDARISIDDHEMATGTYDGELPPGVHLVRVTADGYPSRESRLTLASGERRQLELELQLAATTHTESGPITSEWWFWTLIGVAVVGATVAIVIAATTTNIAAPIPGDDGNIIETLRF